MSGASAKARRPRDALLTAAGVGVLTGLAGTYPGQLGPAVCLPAWAVVGLVLGLLTGSSGREIVTGTAYGVCLTFAFLYSRFGGAPHALPAYTVFVLVMSVGGAAAGVVTVLVGSRLRGSDAQRDRVGS